MLGDPRTIEPGIDLILVSRHLERVGDHATNIAEDVIFIVEARDVRHHGADRIWPVPAKRPDQRLGRSVAPVIRASRASQTDRSRAVLSCRWPLPRSFIRSTVRQRFASAWLASHGSVRVGVRARRPSRRAAVHLLLAGPAPCSRRQLAIVPRQRRSLHRARLRSRRQRRRAVRSAPRPARRVRHLRRRAGRAPRARVTRQPAAAVPRRERRRDARSSGGIFPRWA